MRTALLALACLGLLAAPPALAAPDAPVTVELPSDSLGPAFSPPLRGVSEGYVEEELLVSGAADLFTFANDPPAGPTDLTVAATGLPWKTRLVVRRPAQAGRFNGTVVVEWLNSTAGFDTGPVWDLSHDYFERRGIAYVGVTNANQALSFLVGGCQLFGVLPPACGTRYATLSLPDDGLAYEMMSQISHALRRDDASGLLPPGFHVERLYHTGQSQQGGSVITYADSFHQPGVTDGYFVHANIRSRAINAGPDCSDPASPPFPGCTPRLQGDDRLLRTDLPVPAVQEVGETDVEVLFGTGGRQPDAPNFRYYELAGSAHLTAHKGIEVLPAGFLGPDPLLLEDLCENDLNTAGDGPVFGAYLMNAMWDNLERQVRFGTPPPAGRLMELDASGAVARDIWGNAKGGVRTPEMDVPTGSHNPPRNQADPSLPPFLQQIGNLACFLGGSTTPFDAAILHALYPRHGTYVSQVARAAARLHEDGFLLEKEQQLVVDAAAHAPIGRCGLGFELSLVLPPLVWLRARRRRARR